MKTKNGVYTNLDESDYYKDIKHLRYYFSSKLYLNKFINNYNKYIDEQIEKFRMKYGINLSVELYFRLREYFSIVYYKKVEKRGFKIVDTIENVKI